MNKFKLKSKFKPTGDQPGAIKQLVSGLNGGVKDQVLLGVTGSGKTFTMANVINRIQKPTLVIAHNKTLAAQLAGEFQEFFPDNAVHYFVSYYDYYLPESYIPTTDTYIEKETSINEEIDRLRHASTQALLSRNDVIIVASVSCIYGLGKPEEYQRQSLKLQISNSKFKRKYILNKLVQMRYERNDVDLHRGTFRVRGNTIDVFPSFSLDEIVRLSFKGDNLMYIELLDSLTLAVNLELTTYDLYPATHYVAPTDRINDLIEQIETDKVKEVKVFEKTGKLLEAQRLNQRVSHDIEMMRTTGYCSGIENYSRYFDGRNPGERAYTLMDYFPKDFLLIIDESHMTIPQIGAMYKGDRARKDTLIEYGFRLKSAYDNRPLTFEEFESVIPQTIYVSATPGKYEMEKLKTKASKRKTGDKNSIQKQSQSSKTDGLVEQLIRPTGLVDPKISIRPIKGQIDDLMNEIQKTVATKQRVLVTTMTKRMAEDLAEYLQDADIKACYLHSEIDTLERLQILNDLRNGVYDVLVGINLLREGLDLPEVSLVAILDADKEGFLRSDTALIQTMGRAARHVEGRVIMYADTITGSMKRAIDEVRRRRKIQETYNKKHGITPKGIKKAIKEGVLGYVHRERKDAVPPLPKDITELPGEEIEHIIKTLKSQMELAAQNLEFESAATLRDQIKKLEEHQKGRKERRDTRRGGQFARLKGLRG